METGDVILCVDARDANFITAGTKYMILRVTPGYVRIHDDRNSVSDYRINRFKLYDSTVRPCVSDSLKQVIEEQSDSTRTDSFEINSCWSLVDYEVVAEMMSYSKPMAIVKDDNNKGMIFLHQSIYSKYCTLNIADRPKMPMRISHMPGIYAGLHYFEFNKKNMQLINKVKAFIEEVKRAPYPKNNQPRKITVEVLKVR